MPEEFKHLCFKEFAFLTEQFGFSSEPLPTSEITNPVQVRFVSLTTRVRIEGRAWGESIWISLESMSGRWARLVDILAIRSPQLIAQFRQRGDQRVLLRQAAIAVRENASDVLSGDFSVFDIVETHRKELHQRLRDDTAT
jgi:hypothetical protein